MVDNILILILIGKKDKSLTKVLNNRLWFSEMSLTTMISPIN